MHEVTREAFFAAVSTRNVHPCIRRGPWPYTSEWKLNAGAGPIIGRSEEMTGDPDQLNDRRADWANTAIEAFRQATGADPEDALADLLCDLRHWADRIGKESFETALNRANEHYRQETIAPAPAGE